MNDASVAADDQTLPPELDAERSTEPRDASALPERDRVLLTSVAAELAARSNRTESASVEVAAIEVRMQGLVEELTAMAGTSTDSPPTPKPAEPE